MANSKEQAFRETLASAKRIIILSGAGLSVASGIPSFRGASADPNVNFDMHTAEAFAKVPGTVWMYHQRMRALSYDAKPNNAHKAIALLNLPSVLARVAPEATAPPLHITQNIDGLALRVFQDMPDHIRAQLPEDSSETVLQMHGSIFATRCTSCKHVNLSWTRSPPDSAKMDAFSKYWQPQDPMLLPAPTGSDANSETGTDIPTTDLPRCGGDTWAGRSNRYGKCGGLLRPDVVWFGEIPPQMGEIARKMNWCDLLIVVGTSFSVQPAAGFAKQVKDRGGKIAIFNAEPSPGDTLADFLFLGKCEEILPRALGVEFGDILSEQLGGSIAWH